MLKNRKHVEVQPSDTRMSTGENVVSDSINSATATSSGSNVRLDCAVPISDSVTTSALNEEIGTNGMNNNQNQNSLVSENSLVSDSKFISSLVSEQNSLVSDSIRSATATSSGSNVRLDCAVPISDSVATNALNEGIGANGINNNHDQNSLGDELSSSVVIEVSENEQNEDSEFLNQMVEIETTIDDERCSSSQDDGMMSSAVTSTSSSVMSVDHREVETERRPPLPVPPPPPLADQPEVADFLDMDFDVEPTSTDDEDKIENSSFDRKVDFLKNGGPSDNYDYYVHHGDTSRATCSAAVNTAGNYEENAEMDHDYVCSDSSAWHFNRNSSTAPKNGLLTPRFTTEPLICVHGCCACDCDCSRDGRSQSARSRQRPTIVGDLHSANPSTFPLAAEAQPSSSVACASSESTTFPRSISRRHHHRSIRQLPPGRGLGRGRNLHIGGPDGVQLARSANVGFPTTSRPGSGFSDTNANDAGDSYRIWTIEEAEDIQATQIGPSACGATALINVFRALGDDFANISRRDVEEVASTRLRANDAPVADYLLSRSVAGTDAEDLFEAASALTNGRIRGRFFPMSETTITNASQEERFARWLLTWLRNGAIPVLTLNMQRGLLPTEPMPDAWHHQMVFGVCTKMGGVYLTNPLECVPLWFLKHALCSPSVLLVKAEDVRERWHGRAADLSSLFSSSPELSLNSRSVPTTRWTEMNVLGQIAHTLRQTALTGSTSNTEPLMTHVAIPARYRSGVTLFALAESETWTAIINHPHIDDALSSLLPWSSSAPNAIHNRESNVTNDEPEPEASSVEIIEETADGFEMHEPATSAESGDDNGLGLSSGSTENAEEFDDYVGNGQRSHSCVAM